MRTLYPLCPGLVGRVPRVAVVIVTWNKRDYVLTLLESLFANPYPNWRILIVDNASSDGTRTAVMERFPEVAYIENPVNIGGSGGFNTGMASVLREGGYEYVWLLDNDVEVCPGALEILIETLESRPDAGVAGSHIMMLDHPGMTNEIGADVDLPGGKLILRHHRTASWRHRKHVYEVEYVAACSLLVRFDVLKRVGIFDDLFIHFDDVDWCLRVREAGYKVLACSASRIRHMSADVKRVTWILYYDIRNMLYLQHKYLGLSIMSLLYYVWKRFVLAVRDEFGGKSAYATMSLDATRDFLLGRMGRNPSLAFPKTLPRAEVISTILGTHPREILAMEPISRPVFTAEQFAQASASGISLTAITDACGAGNLGALPPEAHREPVSRSRWKRALKTLAKAVFRPKADWLMLDVDRPCGLLGLRARRIALLVDDGCLVADGGWRRLAGAARLFLRLPALIWALLTFMCRKKRLRACAAITPDEMNEQLLAMGGTLVPSPQGVSAKQSA